MKKLISWNVNGIRAAHRKGLLNYLQKEQADIVCLQETKAKPEQLAEELLQPLDYTSYFSSAERPGYSGTAVYTKQKPLSVSTLEVSEYDAEGRTLVLEFPEFMLINGYFPNSQDGGARLDYKIGYCETVQQLALKHVQAGRHVIVCGDYNVAHKPIDLARPEQNENSAGYLPEEREWMSSFLDSGFADTFRMFNGEGGSYTWWSYRTRGRERNVGWRLDYFCVDDSFRNQVEAAEIRSRVMGSDHCPVYLQLA